MQKIPLLLIFVFITSCSETKDSRDVFSLIKTQKHETIEGEFYSTKLPTTKRLENILRNVDFLETGNLVEKFPLSGIRAKFLVSSKEELFVVTMISPPRGVKGEIFHLRRARIEEGQIYTVDELPDYTPLRIFKNDVLWRELDAEL
jgi:hypothetical protein